MDMANKPTQQHFLVEVDRMIDWGSLAPQLDAINTRVRHTLPMAAFKLLLSSRWYGLVDGALRDACIDRVSFRRFLGWPETLAPDDARSLEAMQRGMKDAGIDAQNLVNSVESQLLARGFTVRPGLWAEAEVVPFTARSTADVTRASATTFFQPGEMDKMLKHAEGVVARMGARIADKPPTTGSGKPAAPIPARMRAEEAPVYGVVEWPWGATLELREHLNIGREASFCPVAKELLAYGHVSRRHAELLVYGDGIWVRDLGSSNGTYVNDDEIPKGQAYLVDADSRIRFGPNLVIMVKIKQ